MHSHVWVEPSCTKLFSIQLFSRSVRSGASPDTNMRVFYLLWPHSKTRILVESPAGIARHQYAGGLWPHCKTRISVLFGDFTALLVCGDMGCAPPRGGL